MHAYGLAETGQVNGDIIGACPARWCVVARLEVQIPVSTAGGARQKVLELSDAERITTQVPCRRCRSRIKRQWLNNTTRQCPHSSER